VAFVHPAVTGMGGAVVVFMRVCDLTSVLRVIAHLMMLV
jgi:hypothetical protein